MRHFHSKPQPPFAIIITCNQLLIMCGHLSRSDPGPGVCFETKTTGKENNGRRGDAAK